jgi:nitrous oxidase accessory protein
VLNTRSLRTAAVFATLLVALLLSIFGAPPAQAQDDAGHMTTPAIPADRLAEAIAAAMPGDTIHVDGGVFTGNLVIDKPLTIMGHNWPVLDAQSSGTVITITAPNVTISGLDIRNSGDLLDREDSGINVSAPNATIAGNRFTETLFGVFLSEAHGSVVRDNIIDSMSELDIARRGDPVRIWSSNDVILEGNQIDSGRDVVLWYSERLTVRDNDITNGRYGLHFMYCDDAVISHNRLLNNSVGAYLMYSRRLDMNHNTVAFNRGPSGYGIGMKDLDDARVEENLFLDNRVGAYLDGTPFRDGGTGLFRENVFGYNDIGILMLPSVKGNEFYDNSFVDNEQQMSIAGSGALPESNDWTVNGRGNYWSDYGGYDADGDGRGEMAYRSDKLFEDLTEAHPNLRLFLYSPAINAVEFAAKAFPLVKPQPKLVDEVPLTAPLIPDGAPPLPRVGGSAWWGIAPALLVLALAIALWPRWRRRYYQLNSGPTGPGAGPSLSGPERFGPAGG